MNKLLTTTVLILICTLSQQAYSRLVCFSEEQKAQVEKNGSDPGQICFTLCKNTLMDVESYYPKTACLFDHGCECKNTPRNQAKPSP